MTRIVAETQIGLAREAVFDFVTTPVYWPHWHPSSVSVDITAGGPLEIGAQVIESINVGGQRDKVLWTVVERDRPRVWAISGRGERGGRAVLRYELIANRFGTLFRRDLTYAMPNRVLALLDRLLFRHLMIAASLRALERLKSVLEASERVALREDPAVPTARRK